MFCAIRTCVILILWFSFCDSHLILHPQLISSNCYQISLRKNKLVTSLIFKDLQDEHTVNNGPL